jgi:hypothetical protein
VQHYVGDMTRDTKRKQREVQDRQPAQPTRRS